ncbi:MAG: septum formation protein Maf [Phycisphaerae bacterium]|nr:septum formation protein Maf [Phycisphaerae bacterium]
MADRLILASASPRRAELLRENGYAFDVRPPPYEEPDAESPRLSATEHAEALSFYKARSVAETLPAGLVLAADTVVAHQDRIFGKPEDADDARSILSSLTGTTHEVITGVTLLDAATGSRLIRHDVTRVTMRPMPPAAMDKYIASKAWWGKAGAYGIQDHGDAFVEQIDGSFSNVVGLPMELLAEMLEEFEDARQSHTPDARRDQPQ